MRLDTFIKRFMPIFLFLVILDLFVFESCMAHRCGSCAVLTRPLLLPCEFQVMRLHIVFLPQCAALMHKDLTLSGDIDGEPPRRRKC